jgi:hypothetical protein
MKKFIWCALLLMPAIALAEPSTQRGTRNGLPYFKSTESVSDQGSVVKVDKEARDVWIQTSDGDTVIVTCGPEVKNFSKIAKGDVVKVKYTETLTVHVEEGGAPTTGVESSTETAKPGEKPKGRLNAKLKVSATITAIDKAKGTATLKSQDGDEFEIAPMVPENLDKVKIGQLVVFTYEEAMGVSVEKVKQEKKK